MDIALRCTHSNATNDDANLLTHSRDVYIPHCEGVKMQFITRRKGGGGPTCTRNINLLHQQCSRKLPSSISKRREKSGRNDMSRVQGGGMKSKS